MKVKTSELVDAALDWSVAEAAGYLSREGDHWMLQLPYVGPRINYRPGEKSAFSPSTRWAQGGPIMEQEGIELICNLNPAEAATFKTEPHWRASKRAWSKGDVWYGPTPLVAAMRCFVASKLGDEVDVPEEFKE